MNRSYSFALLSLACVLGACSNNTVKDKLGLERKPPDEFRVVARPPLSVPPQFVLQPPSTAASSPILTPADKQAQSLLTGTAPDQSNTFSLKPASATAAPAVMAKPASAKSLTPTAAAESEFLKDAGADKADPNVRSQLTEEKIEVQENQEEKEGHWWDFMDFSTGDSKEPTVDAKKEAARIQQDKATGQPITQGATPDVQQKDTGILGRIFGY